MGKHNAYFGDCKSPCSPPADRKSAGTGKSLNVQSGGGKRYHRATASAAAVNKNKSTKTPYKNNKIAIVHFFCLFLRKIK
ncbi:MAG: hypothetical protein Q4F82_04770 [bacterium]|nr:hypothetical protein [bacterium]